MNSAAETEPVPGRNDPERVAASSDDMVEADGELGAISIHNNVIMVIARAAARSVKGVLELGGGFVDGLAGMISKKSVERGVHVDASEQGVVLDIHVNLEYGVRIPEVAWQIQHEVRRNVEQMTGKNVQAVNVIVHGVVMPDERRKPDASGTLPRAGEMD